MNQSPLVHLRRRINDLGLTPRSRLARVALAALTLEVMLFLLQRFLVASAGRDSAAGLDQWINFLTVCNVILYSVLGLRWTRRVLMWRLRNRLVITYIFIGVIPILLIVLMVGLSAYLISGQFAALLVHSDLDAEIKSLQAANTSLASTLAATLEHGGTTSAVDAANLTAEFPRAEFTAWYGGKPLVSTATAAGGAGYPGWARDDFAGIVEDSDQQLFLRALSVKPTRSGTLTAVTSVPLDESTLAGIAGPTREVTVFKTNVRMVSNQTGVTVDVTPQGGAERQAAQRDFADPKNRVRSGSVPAPANALDRRVSWILILNVTEWRDGKQTQAMAQVVTRVSALYTQLFSNSSGLGEGIQVALLALAIVFGVIEVVALVIGIGLTRTVTGSVAALYRGTEHVNRGDFSHRIKVKSRDQLAALETSFNSMTESLEHLIQEQKEKQRLQSELAIAQEVQAQLFPRHDLKVSSLELHGVCKPARTVSGDYYDFLPLGTERMAMAVGDISGKGISAALLMATIHSAVRVYEFGGIPKRAQLIAAGAAALAGARSTEPDGRELMARNGIQSPSQVLWLLNRHLFHSTPAEKYATMFLGVYDGQARRLTYCNAGHLPPLIIKQSGEVKKLETGGMVIGLFESIDYEEAVVELKAGDLFVAYSDGVTEPENEFGEFGERRLTDLLRENRNLPLDRLSELVLGAVQEWMGEVEQPDDLTLVLARAR